MWVNNCQALRGRLKGKVTGKDRTAEVEHCGILYGAGLESPIYQRLTC